MMVGDLNLLNIDWLCCLKFKFTKYRFGCVALVKILEWKMNILICLEQNECISL